MIGEKMKKFLFPLLFISNIFLANWFIENFGLLCPDNSPCLIPVWFDVYAPSGVLAIGLGFTLRDLTQRYCGLKWAIISILIGSFVSIYISPQLALASGLSFFLSEIIDLGVYTPLQKRNLTLAFIGSNIVGLIVDSIVFLGLAFGSFEFLAGQIIGKFWMTLIVLPVIYLLRKYEINKKLEK